jgi:hypothetical protein
VELVLSGDAIGGAQAGTVPTPTSYTVRQQ